LNTVPSIRQATPKDHATLKGIIGLSFPRFLRFFASHSLYSEEGRVLVCESQGAVVGFAKLIEFKIGRSKYGCILWLAVHPGYRRKGIASDLVKVGTEDLKQDGAKAVFASVQRRNKASLATFGKNDFKRMRFLGLWHLFGLRVFSFYRNIWLAPGEIALMHNS
jgi:ribosomal protein S18 acetylase RimI-like enzyme